MLAAGTGRVGATLGLLCGLSALAPYAYFWAGPAPAALYAVTV